ncbi:MAG: glutaredoxin 3 [Candidatus Caenarcaniphilales bacterium]|nr:glutaredoxin 3 [Candidatus Caenarcaniphilales bacterium]
MPHKEVEIYTTTYCPYCVKAKTLLTRKGVAYKEISVDDDVERTKMIERTGGARTVPQIFIGGEFIAGGADGLLELESKGQLDQLLAI